ncbi:MAG: hypothetical protein NUW22_11195 [Acidobacteria bacterium]|nr:hypothetical protein [Acidobacteriota bacterium]
MSERDRTIGIYYEHPDWFRPMFSELDRRGMPYRRIDASAHAYDPSNGREEETFSLVFNRMSPSAYLRGHKQGIFHTLGYLEHLESRGVRVINGLKAFRNEISKAHQITLLRSLGLAAPRARVINAAGQAPAAAAGLRFPVVVKANIGGSGAGIVRFNAPDTLQRAADAGLIDLGIDDTALVQEYIPAKGGHITRVEVLGGKFLYAIKVFTTGDTFNLCPADICHTTGGEELVRSACAVDAPKSGLTVEGCVPPPDVIDAVERIADAAGIDVGGIEYTIDDRDGRLYYYDINALSNFVADATRVVGFDPFARLVDYLEQEAGVATLART